MKQQKFVFYRYSFQEDPDTIPDKRVAEENYQPPCNLHPKR